MRRSRWHAASTIPPALFHALAAIVPARLWHKYGELGLRAGREAIELAKRLGHPEWAVGYVTGWHFGGLLEVGDAVGRASDREVSS